MKLLVAFKRVVEKIPYPVGRVVAHIPYSLRLGRTYSKYSKFLPLFESFDPFQKNKFVIKQLNNIVQYAQSNIPFYKELYGKGIIQIEKMSDFEELPIITRGEVRDYTQRANGAMLLNTGGTSGEPLSFYVDNQAWAREWAHMHYIWARKGYKVGDLMVTMLGKNLFGHFYKYNAVHHELRLNPYVDAGENINHVRFLFERYPISFFQGYPSSIYNFLREIETVADDHLRDLIRKKIRCCLFSSEYPLPYMTKYIRTDWMLDYISWYGHSEMCILAYEDKQEGSYLPLLTYGLAEVCNGILCGTSYNNFDMPLIRYSTGDFVEGKVDETGLLRSFVVTQGRSGDYVQDTNGRHLSLTALIFGRHHLIFNYADYVQVYQRVAGELTILVTLKPGKNLPQADMSKMFDTRDANFQFSFRTLKEPILTKSGKLKLLVSDSDISAIGVA